jgi:hypothetical protein
MPKGDHFYTTATTECDNALAFYGYVLEGAACFVFGAQTTLVAGATALFRLYNLDNGDHFYTTSATERDSVVAGGYTSEGTACFAFSSADPADPGRVPFFRLYNPGNGDHFYTTSAEERDNALIGGYTNQGIACFVYSSARTGTVPLFRLYKPNDLTRRILLHLKILQSPSVSITALFLSALRTGRIEFVVGVCRHDDDASRRS